MTPPAALAGVAAKASWAQPQITVVTARGLMGGRAATFRPDAPLTHSALERLVADLTDRKHSAPTAPTTPATMAELDAALVRGARPRRRAAAFAATARAAGLKPPARFGTEVVARLLGLRTNHPAGQDSLELLPADSATRAEAAYSAARVLALRATGRQSACGDAALDFELPALTAVAGPCPPHRRLAHRLSLRLGRNERGAAGAVRLAGARRLRLLGLRLARLQASAVRGRDTARDGDSRPHDDADERRGAEARPDRARRASSPATCSSSARAARSPQPAQVDHTAIYLGGGWLIHSSAYGVALAPLSGWYASSFAWARRPLAEAQLA